MTISWDSRAASAGKKIEIGAAIGLHYVIEVELVVAAFEDRLRSLPLLFASYKLAV